MANIPSDAWDETDPAGSDFISAGDDSIRDTWTKIREIVGVDHKFESSGQGATWGFHEVITLIQQSSKPSAVTACGQLYQKLEATKNELFYEDEEGNETQITSGGGVVVGDLTGLVDTTDIVDDAVTTDKVADATLTYGNVAQNGLWQVDFQRAVADDRITATSYTTVDSMSSTITITGTDSIILIDSVTSYHREAGATCPVDLCIYVDGVQEANSEMFSGLADTAAGIQIVVPINYIKTGLAAGSHTFDLRCKMTAGDAIDIQERTFRVVELKGNS